MSDRIDAREFDIDRFRPGVVERCWVRLYELPGWGPVEVPVIVARGTRPGPVLFAVAGIHGNEYEGMDAIRTVATELDPESMHGAFVALVTANPFAYASRTRESPRSLDGANLARVFPGDPDGTPTQRLAAELLALITRSVGSNDLLLDLHSGTAEVAFATMVGFRTGTGPGRTRSEEAARHMGLPLLWEIPDSAGPLNAETARIGIPSIGTETTGRAGCRREDVEWYCAGLRNLLAWLGICPDWPKAARDESTPRTTLDLGSPASGFLRVETSLLAEVSEGDRLAVIVDPFGTSIAEVISPVSGTIWAIRETPKVDTGDLLGMIARAR